MRTVELDPNIEVQEVLRKLYAEYAHSMFDMLLKKSQDPLIAWDALRSIFQDVYRMMRETGTTDITAMWLSMLAKTHLERRLAASKANRASLSQTGTQPAKQIQYTAKQIPDWDRKKTGPMERPAMSPERTAYPGVTAGQPAVRWRSMLNQPMQEPQRQQPYRQTGPTGAMPYEQRQPVPTSAPARFPQPVPQQQIHALPRQEPKPEPEGPKFSSEELPEEEIATDGQSKKLKIGRLAAMSGLGVLIVGSLWAIVGLLMSMQILPAADLGYQWFNANIYNVF